MTIRDLEDIGIKHSPSQHRDKSWLPDTLRWVFTIMATVESFFTGEFSKTVTTPTEVLLLDMVYAILAVAWSRE